MDSVSSPPALSPTPQDFLEKEMASVTAESPSWFREALAIPREEGIVELAGCPIHYFRWGDKGKRGVLMTHGFLAHARCFAFIAPFLARDYDVIAYDISGMGDSGTRPNYTDAHRTEELRALADHAEMTSHAQKPFIIAHSYGGGVGLGAAETYPDAFGGLVICDMMIMRPERIEGYMSNRENIIGQRKRPHRVYPDLPTAMARYRLAPPQVCENDYLMQYMAYHSLREAEGGWSWKFDPGIFLSDTRSPKWWKGQAQRIVNLKTRRAILHGETSILFDSDSASYMREIGGHDLPVIAIPHASHHLMLDQPLAFASALRSVLEVWHRQDA